MKNSIEGNQTILVFLDFSKVFDKVKSSEITAA